jgi:hypothetical protein
MAHGLVAWLTPSPSLICPKISIERGHGALPEFMLISDSISISIGISISN